MKQYYVYIMASYRGTLYTGVTNNLLRRVQEHREKLVAGFTSKYNVSKLVYYEETDDILLAIAREKQIKGWVRREKVDLTGSVNPYWEDLAQSWLQASPPPQTLHFVQGDRDFQCHSERSESRYIGTVCLFAWPSHRDV